MLPLSEPGGSVGTSRLTVPSSEDAGQLVPGVELLIRACAGVHAVRPAAADGFSVMPSGNLIAAVFTCAESISSLGKRANAAVALTPTGWSDAVVDGVSEKLGSNGTSPQPLSARRVSYGFWTDSRAPLARCSSTSFLLPIGTPSRAS